MKEFANFQKQFRNQFQLDSQVDKQAIDKQIKMFYRNYNAKKESKCTQGLITAMRQSYSTFRSFRNDCKRTLSKLPASR